MTLRTKSRTSQWVVWSGVALVVICICVIILRMGFNLSGTHLLGKVEHRTLLVAVAVFFCIAHETRWDGVRRERKAEEKDGEKVEVQGQEKTKCEGEERDLTPCAAACSVRTEGANSDLTRQGAANTEEPGAERHVHCPPPPRLSTSPTQPSVEPATGEALFEKARALPHQMVPDFETDGPYLELLGKSAAQGYAPALAKLGEYAMRRAAWVESYYWMSMAKRRGMQGLANVKREIRKNWALDGFPDEAENVNPLFTVEAGSLGRALIHVDSGHEAAKAREFLKANYPEFVT